VIWETGFLETVSRNIGSIYKTELFQELLKIVLRRAAKRLGVETGLEAPGKEFTETEIASGLLKTSNSSSVIPVRLTRSLHVGHVVVHREYVS